jgi:hypothetical protein
MHSPLLEAWSKGATNKTVYGVIIASAVNVAVNENLPTLPMLALSVATSQHHDHACALLHTDQWRIWTGPDHGSVLPANPIRT